MNERIIVNDEIELHAMVIGVQARVDVYENEEYVDTYTGHASNINDMIEYLTVTLSV